MNQLERPNFRRAGSVQGDKKNVPPSRALMKSSGSDEKLSNAFSNPTYLDIIWKIS